MFLSGGFVMKNFVFGFVVLSILAIANDSFAGCRGCGRSGLGIRANKSSCSAAPKAACSAPKAAPVAAPAVTKAAEPKAAASACASGSCGIASGLRSKLRLR
jgi:hypothetical protein